MQNNKILPLVDITRIKIDPTLPDADRLRLFTQAVGDPYHFRVGETPVTVVYNDHSPDLQKVLTSLCQNLQ